MYYLYLDNELMPITPEKVQIKIKGGNKTISLINEGEVNQIKPSKLTEISFDLLLPNQAYPFALYKNGEFLPPSYFLDLFEKLKAKKKPFKFKLLRTDPQGNSLFDTSLDVTMESCPITEDAKEGFDVQVGIELKEWRDYGVTTIKVKKSSGKTKVTKKKTAKKSSSKKSKSSSYVVKSGDTLWAIAKKYLGNGGKWKTIYNANKSIIEKAAKSHGYASSATGHWIFPGTKLTIPAKE